MAKTNENELVVGDVITIVNYELDIPDEPIILLENPSIKDDELRDVLEKQKDGRKLEITGKKITDEQFKIIAEFLHAKQYIQTLSITNYVLEDTNFSNVGQLLQASTGLTKLNFICNKIRTEGLKWLTKAIENYPRVTSIDLSHNHFSDQGAIVLGNFLKTNTTLQELSIGGNSIRSEGVLSIMEGLKSNSSLRSIDLYYNYITTQATPQIADMLRLNTTLIELNLNDNVITSDGLKTILSGLKNSPIDRFRFSHNSIGEDGIRYLKDFLLQKPTAKVLNLSCNLLSPGSIKDISEILKSNTNLIELNLANLESFKVCATGKVLSTNAVKTLMAALGSNNSLQILHLYHIELEDQGAGIIAKFLLTNTTLKTLYIDRNALTDKSATFFSEVLKRNTTLEELLISYNEITNVGAKTIAEALKDNFALKTLRLSWNKIQHDGVKAIGQALTSNTTLTTIDIEDEVIEQLIKRNKDLVKAMASKINSVEDLSTLSLADKWFLKICDHKLLKKSLKMKMAKDQAKLTIEKAKLLEISTGQELLFQMKVVFEDDTKDMEPSGVVELSDCNN